MKNLNYFRNENYSGDHLHVDDWEDELIPFVEAIAWVRNEKSMDLFFDDFMDKEEMQYFKTICENDNFKGIFLGNVQTNEEAFIHFKKWVKESLYPYRQKRQGTYQN